MTFDPKEARALVERLDMFTPGPWVRDCWDILGKAPGTGIVAEICRPGELDSEFWKIGEPDNNARLIAAAPDLHRHLTAALDEIERLRGTLTQIERTYYTEGKADKWRAVKMNEIAYAAQNGGTDQ